VVTARLLRLPLPAGWSGGWRSTLLDFGHVPLFAGVVLAWAVPGRPVWRAALLAVVLAGAAEVVQALVGRTADRGDFARGVLGALAGAIAVRAWRVRRRPAWAACPTSGQ
jgi:hypothetical protein